MIVESITSLDRPELEPYLTLREHTRHWKQGHFVAEGEKVVRRVLESDCEIISMLMSEQRFEELHGELEEKRFAPTVVFTGSAELVRSIVGFQLHKNLMAIVRIPDSVSRDELETQSDGRHVSVALEGIADSENMGMILRNCAGLGVRHLIVGPDSCSPYLRRSVRVSIGAVLSLGIHRSPDVVETLAGLKASRGWRVVGATPRGGAATVDHVRCVSSRPLCVLLGSEARGLSREALCVCDDLFSIPMHGEVDSLNVANAAAIAIYEATRASRTAHDAN